MITPLYVVKALADIRENGSLNMLDREGVTALCSARASEWLSKASNQQYMDALLEMGMYIDGELFDDIIASEDDPAE